MARKNTSATTTATTTKVAQKSGGTRRITSLEPKASRVLSSLEEGVVRMHHGVSVKPQAVLATNGASDELMAQLFEMEVRAHIESNRIDDLPDVPAGKKQRGSKAPNERTAKVVAELKKKK